jgi:catechol 2,3-dioxygenase-like lactoylglutathione lyase family enzyme
MNIRRIKETCLYVQDLPRTRSFYSGLLHLPVISFVVGRHAFFRAGDSVLLCFIAEKTEQETVLPPHGARGCIHFAFEVGTEDYTAACRQIEEAGIDIIHYHAWGNGKRSFYFHDPDAHLVEILEEGLWEED